MRTNNIIKSTRKDAYVGKIISYDEKEDCECIDIVIAEPERYNEKGELTSFGAYLSKWLLRPKPRYRLAHFLADEFLFYCVWINNIRYSLGYKHKYEKEFRLVESDTPALGSGYLYKSKYIITHCHAAMTAEKQHSLLQSNKISNNLKPLQP